MTDQITLKEALQLVSFYKDSVGKWRVAMVHGDVDGNVDGNVFGGVFGNVAGNVRGNVGGSVFGTVLGTISGKKWAFIEAPREKLARLIKEKGDQELIKAFNELEDSND